MSTHDTQRRLVLHGALVLAVALACGLPAVIEAASGSSRMWQGAHSALLVLGVWLLATGAVAPLLVLGEREAAGLQWSLLLMTYAFMPVVVVQAVLGERSHGPDQSPVKMAIFVANVLAVLGAFLTVGLTAMGAWNGLRVSGERAGGLAR